jgi:hypothetical protein
VVIVVDAYLLQHQLVVEFDRLAAFGLGFEARDLAFEFTDPSLKRIVALHAQKWLRHRMSGALRFRRTGELGELIRGRRYRRRWGDLTNPELPVLRGWRP